MCCVFLFVNWLCHINRKTNTRDYTEGCIPARKPEDIAGESEVEVFLASASTVAGIWLTQKNPKCRPPKNYHSWFQGQVVSSNNQSITVKFYDNEEATFPSGWPMRKKEWMMKRNERARKDLSIFKQIKWRLFLSVTETVFLSVEQRIHFQ